jgi:hypothetical protein
LRRKCRVSGVGCPSGARALYQKNDKLGILPITPINHNLTTHGSQLTATDALLLRSIQYHTAPKPIINGRNKQQSAETSVYLLLPACISKARTIFIS